MRVLAATGDIWGISGPVFLELYAALAIATGIATLLIRRSLARSQAPAPAPATGLVNPDYVAYLHDGSELTVLAALSALHVAGRLTSAGPRRVQATGAIGSDAGELQQAIHRCAQDPIQPAKLVSAPPVVEALSRIERRLIDAGLLLSAGQRTRIRASSWMLWAVVAVGVLRGIPGHQAGKPIGLLLTVLALVTVAAVVFSVTAPRRTDRGKTELVRLRSAHASLSPKLRPRWRVYGPEGAALGVAVFGASALWAADPSLAKDLGARQMLSASGSGGEGWSGGAWGGEGCGGGGGGCGSAAGCGGGCGG
jgi:uncharacterized protein (TIGR04222 family)